MRFNFALRPLFRRSVIVPNRGETFMAPLLLPTLQMKSAPPDSSFWRNSMNGLRRYGIRAVLLGGNSKQDAVARARSNEPQYRGALTDYGVARENTVQSRAALLPNVNYTTSFLYTQGNGVSGPRFITNNAVHEYLSQGNAQQALSLQNVAEYRRARAQEALAKAMSEIAT